MHLKRLEISGFKSFAKKSVFEFGSPVSAIVGPNGSGKSNVAEAIRFVLGEQSMKSLRGKRGEDLIWNGSQSMGRGNHASVMIVFDNTNKEFDVDYEEVAIKRQVSRDGSNQYFINNSQVRLRDIIELLAKVHIGATGHHIISQGEADRILNANIKERRAMIEEALGLKIYQWKIEESEKKLVKTEENIAQAGSLRREIAPHLRFLKKQVEKIEKAMEMREDLKGLYAEYLKREQTYLACEGTRVAEEKRVPEETLKKLEGELGKIRTALSEQEKDDPKKGELARLEADMSEARKKKDELSRSVGRIEGMIEFEERRVKKTREQKTIEAVPYRDMKYFTDVLEEHLMEAEKKSTIEGMRTLLVKMRESLRDFLARMHTMAGSTLIDESELDAMKAEKGEVERKCSDAVDRVHDLEDHYARLKHEIEKEKDSSRELERSMFAMMAEKSELSARVSRLRDEEELLIKGENALKEEIKEGIALIGRDVMSYEQFVVDDEEVMAEPRDAQEKRRKDIEKIKIKLEEEGLGGGDEVMKEHKEVTERDEFLAREIADLEKSAESLRALMAELTEKLDNDFKEGIEKINRQFQEFFALMFGGGGASLIVSAAQKKRKRSDSDIPLEDEALPEEEEETEGIDINVSLPRKKIKGLQMLSGGERALTSIALIFAVSQVNPPPFLVLDETDAALDEANSRKYGDMIVNLSKHSQLIVITHNRETMSRASILYGVTMGSDAVSKLLSVRFEEAEGYAK